MKANFRYTRCPQGACIAVDAYNRRHAAVTAEVPRKEAIVDDTLLYDDLSELEQHGEQSIISLYVVKIGSFSIKTSFSLPTLKQTLLDFVFQTLLLSPLPSIWMPS